VDHELRAGDAVDRAVVHLGDHADVAVGEPLDHVELPQRPRPVEGGGGDLGRQLGELAHAAGARGTDAADVEVEVEVGVLDPDGVTQPERHLDDPAAERRDEVQP
jgi:hypothetical protein